MTISLQDIWQRYGEVLISGALNVLAAFAILVIGLYAAAAAGRAMRRTANRHPRIDDTLARFFALIVRYAIIGFVVVAVLNRFGVATTSIVAVLGAGALAVGLALQGTLSNLAAGVMLILFRPYRLGDYVDVGDRSGTVLDINLFTTVLKSVDNARIVLPNGICWGAPMVNYTAFPYRRVDLDFGVAYDTDLDHAIATLEDMLEKHSAVLADPAPMVQVKTLGDFAITLWVRAWVRTPDFLNAKLALVKAGKAALDADGIGIPFPTTLNYEIRLPPPPSTAAAKKSPAQRPSGEESGPGDTGED